MTAQEAYNQSQLIKPFAPILCPEEANKYERFRISYINYALRAVYDLTLRKGDVLTLKYRGNELDRYNVLEYFTENKYKVTRTKEKRYFKYEISWAHLKDTEHPTTNK